MEVSGEERNMDPVRSSCSRVNANWCHQQMDLLGNLINDAFCNRIERRDVEEMFESENEHHGLFDIVSLILA
jgi:hypothetical protein